MENDLLYDVGMNNGNDTAFYLACGFRVLAIEADPDLVAATRLRFQAEIESERLVILNVGVAERNATADFWINETGPHFNSFSRELASRFGDPVHSIRIPCRRLDEILSEYGVPLYLKIDIEGNDIVCCNQLSKALKPKYISLEMSQMELLTRLRDLGYDRFKLIMQHDLQPIARADIEMRVRVLRSIYRVANYRIEDRRLSARLRRAAAAKLLQAGSALWGDLWETPKPFKSKMAPGWNFIEGCSGSFGDDLPGEWLTWQEIARLWERDLKEYQKMDRELWCDLHATTSD